MNKKSKRTPIEELEKLLNSDEEAPIEILPNGEIRAVKKRKGKQPKVIKMREDLGGEYGQFA